MQMDSVMRLKSVKFLPPYALVIGMVLIYIFGRIDSSVYFFQVVLGVVCLGIGCALLYALYKYHSSCWSQIPINQVHDIYEVWPYTFTRNPVNVSVLLILLSVALFTGNMFNLITALIYFAYSDRLLIPEHESNMLKYHRNKYTEYCAIVSRWGI